MRNACDKKKEHMSKVKVNVTENTKTTIWAITSEPEVVETSGWFQNVPCQNIYQKCSSPHDAWHSVFASHDVNSEPIDFKIGTHIDFTCTIYHLQNCTNKNNITRITMATKYPIIKHRAFFKTLIAAYHPFILDGFLWNFAYEISLKSILLAYKPQNTHTISIYVSSWNYHRSIYYTESCLLLSYIRTCSTN